MPKPTDLTMIEPDDATAVPAVPTPLRKAKAKPVRRPTDLTKIEPDDATAPPAKKYAKGGYVRSADGIARKGKTRGKMC